MRSDKRDPILYLMDSRGVYIPQNFAEMTRRDCIRGVDDWVFDTLLRGPDGEWYWDAWAEIEAYAVVTDPDTGIEYRVYQDGDCWLLPDGMTVNDAGEFVEG